MTYMEEQKRKLSIRLEKVLREMPSFCRTFFYSKENNQAIRTQERFSYSLRQFMNFIAKEFDMAALDLERNDLDYVTLAHIEKYLIYCNEQEIVRRGKEMSVATIADKIYSLNVFFKFFKKRREIKENPVEMIEPPRRESPEIVNLDDDEIEAIINAVEKGFRVPNGKRRLNPKWVLRDKTMIMTFLYTGIRVSELVGLNIGDINLKHAEFYVTRKGGKHEKIFMTPELVEQIRNYLEAQGELSNNNPLFKSLYGTRLGTKAVQDAVKFYAKVAEVEKKITPHNLRKTFGGSIYKKTGDIFIVAKLLGNTVKVTEKHYVDADEEDKRNALLGHRLPMPSHPNC